MRKFILIIILLLPNWGTAQDYREKNLEVVDDKINKLSAEDRKLWSERIEEKLNELQNYIITIGDKSQDDETRNLAIKTALQLFVPTATMQVSNTKTKEVNNYEMSKYFNRLKSIGYTRVVITFYQTAYISNLQAGADGRYHATATIYQEFKGYTGDRLAYSDRTTKTVQIILSFFDDDFYKRKRWELLLGDIKVAETRMN